MPKPRRKSKKAATKPDPNAEELALLALFLEEGPGFHLGLAYYDSFPTRQVMLGRLETLVADRPVHLTRLDLSQFPGEEFLLTRLREHMENHPAPEGKDPAVMVVGLEALLDYRELGSSQFHSHEILWNANFQRDAYPKFAATAVVIWLLPTASTIFAQQAPDLWHWRAGTFNFTGPPQARRAIEFENVDMTLLHSQNLRAPGQRDRIALLHELLGQLDNEKDRQTRGHLVRRAALLHELGLAYRNLSKNAQAQASLKEAAELYQRIGDRRGEGAALGDLGNACGALGQTELAIEIFERILVLMRASGDRQDEGKTRGNLGGSYIALGQPEKAIRFYRQSLAIARETADRHGEAIALGNLGTAHAALGQPEKAMEYFDQSLTLDRQLGDRRGEAMVLGNLGYLHGVLGHSEQAVGYFEGSLAIARQLGDRRTEGIALGNLGNAYNDLGHPEKAIALWNEAVKIGHELNDPKIVTGFSNASDQ